MFHGTQTSLKYNFPLLCEQTSNIYVIQTPLTNHLFLLSVKVLHTTVWS